MWITILYRWDNRKDNMTIEQKIKLAHKCYVWVVTCQDDGMYIQVSKSALRKSIKENPHLVEDDKFDLLGNDDLNQLTNLYVN